MCTVTVVKTTVFVVVWTYDVHGVLSLRWAPLNLVVLKASGPILTYTVYSLLTARELEALANFQDFAEVSFGNLDCVQRMPYRTVTVADIIKNGPPVFEFQPLLRLS